MTFGVFYTIGAGGTGGTIYDRPLAYPYDGIHIGALFFSSMILGFGCGPAYKAEYDDDDYDEPPSIGLEYG